LLRSFSKRAEEGKFACRFLVFEFLVLRFSRNRATTLPLHPPSNNHSFILSFAARHPLLLPLPILRR